MQWLEETQVVMWEPPLDLLQFDLVLILIELVLSGLDHLFYRHTQGKIIRI